MLRGAGNAINPILGAAFIEAARAALAERRASLPPEILPPNPERATRVGGAA
jgi:hypothetical protein